MFFCRVALVSLFVSLLGGCSQHRPVTTPPLHPTSALKAPANTPWRLARTEQLNRFKSTQNATLWAISQEMSGRSSSGWPPPAAPIKLGDFEYFSVDTPGSRYPVFQRRRVAGGVETVLDLNREFPTHTVDIGLLRIAPDNLKVAVTLDTDGSGNFNLFTRELPAGELVGPIAPHVHEAEWGSGGSLLFSTLDGLRATRLVRHRPGSKDEVVAIPLGEDGHLAIHPSGDGEIMVREIAPLGGRVWRVKSAEKTIRPSEVKIPGARQGTRVLDGCLLGGGTVVLSEYESMREIVWTPPARGLKAQPLAFAGTTPHVAGMRCFTNHTVVFGRAENRGALWYISLVDGKPVARRVAIPLGLTSLTLGAHPSPEVGIVRVQLSSLINPPLLYELDLKTGEFIPRAQMDVKNYDATAFTTVSLAARASDGVAIPITAAYRVDSGLAGTRPVLLFTYGAYGANASTEFDPVYIPLLERGFIVAVAHIRGGGEGGPSWHRAGRGPNKSVGPRDLIAAAEAFIKLNWGASRQIALTGRSAGAIAVAGAAALRPELFGAVVLDAPFLDPVGALSDPNRPLAIRDRAEWGDPNDPAVRAVMREFAPFHLPLNESYPPTLVTVGLNDAAVSPLEGARWIEHLEDRGSSGHLISMSDGGHQGPPTRSAALNEGALRTTFIITMLSAAHR